MPLYTSNYRFIQEKFHIDRPDYGISGHKWSEHILALATKLSTRSILDYGCGKATLQKSIPYPIQNYDPFIPEYSTRPQPADILISTDVLEHIEPDCLDDVLRDMSALTLKVAFLEVALGPAVKFLPDGRNAHLIQESSNWWLSQLLPFWHIESMTITPSNSVLVIGAPHPSSLQS